MAYLLNILVILLLGIFNFSLLPSFSIFNVVPLLPLFFIIALTYFRKGVEPILLAALAGVFLDFSSSYGFGLYLSLFLGTAVLVRLFFQEGMTELSFISFLAFSLSGLTVYFSLQIFLLYRAGVDLSFTPLIQPFVSFMVVNLVFILIFYPLNTWYFEKIKVLENYQKRR